MNHISATPQNESMCRFIAENSMECIFTYDIRAARFTFISPAVLRLTGYTVSEAMQLSLAQLLPKLSLEKANRIIQLLLDRYTQGERREERLTYCNDYELLCKDKSIKLVEITAKIIYNDQSDFMEMLGIVWDITHRKQNEIVLHQTLERKDEMIQRLNDSETSLKGFIEDLHNKNQMLQDYAARDGLTGIGNRYSFDRKVTEETERSRRHNHPLSIILFDIDHFKEINDTYGHQMGDHVLAGVADTVKVLIRAYDSFARWGGDEFAVLMPQTTLSEAEIVAEKIRNSIQEMQIEAIQNTITASFGVVEFMQGETEASWFRRVDYALLHSKSTGRNRITAMRWEDALPFAQIALEWKSEWECGNPEIDSQHRHLVELGNKLLSGAFTDMQGGQTAELLDEYIRQIRLHSENEETILREIGYSDVEEHVKIHQALLRRTEELQKQYQEGKLTASAIFAFIIDEVVMGHQLTEDIRYFPYIKGSASAS